MSMLLKSVAITVPLKELQFLVVQWQEEANRRKVLADEKVKHEARMQRNLAMSCDVDKLKVAIKKGKAAGLDIQRFVALKELLESEPKAKAKKGGKKNTEDVEGKDGSVSLGQISGTGPRADKRRPVATPMSASKAPSPAGTNGSAQSLGDVSSRCV